MGTITHKDAALLTQANRVNLAEWKGTTLHLDSQGNTLELSRGATLVVAASNASAKSKAGADYVCDGVADDVEIQAALDALPAISGWSVSGGSSITGCVQLSEGTFTVTTAIQLTDYKMLKGQGRWATTIKQGAAVDLIQLPSSGIHYEMGISDMTLLGVRTSYGSGHAIYCASTQIENVRLHNLYLQSCPENNLEVNSFGSFNLHNVKSGDSGESGFWMRGNGGEVYGCHAGSNQLYGFHLQSLTYSALVGCYSTDNQYHGYLLGSSSYNSLIACHSIDDSQNGVSAGSGFHLQNGTSTYNLILGCTIKGANLFKGIRENAAGDDYNTIIGVNILNGGVQKSGANSKFFFNQGYVTENSGTSSIASGDTTKVVAHGLSATPTVVNIAFREQGTSDFGRWWVSAIDGTNFTLNVSADPGASNLDFAWEAKVR